MLSTKMNLLHSSVNKIKIMLISLKKTVPIETPSDHQFWLAKLTLASCKSAGALVNLTLTLTVPLFSSPVCGSGRSGDVHIRHLPVRLSRWPPS